MKLFVVLLLQQGIASSGLFPSGLQREGTPNSGRGTPTGSGTPTGRGTPTLTKGKTTVGVKEEENEPGPSTAG